MYTVSLSSLFFYVFLLFYALEDRLYWSDATFDTIQRCNLNGEDCITILNMTGTYLQEEIRDLETDGDFLYYSAFRLKYVL